MKLQKNLELRLLNWKNKAKQRGEELNNLKKQLKSCRQGSLKWKNKYKKEKSQRLIYEKLLKNNTGVKAVSQKVTNHSYDLETINLSIQIRESGLISLRSCCNLLVLLNLVFKLNLRIPSIGSIRNWEYKKGYYNLQKKGDITEEWVFIIDESYCIGQQTLLVILGVKLKDYNFKKSLNYNDTKLLSLGIGLSWTASKIEDELSKLIERGYRGVYATTDGAKNIAKSLRDSSIPQVEDCTHVFSKLIEKAYKDLKEFKVFTKKCALISRKNYMGKDAEICPPTLKGKSRYLNLYGFSDWGIKNLKLYDYLEKELEKDEKQQRIYEKLKWIENHRDLIKTLSCLVALMESIFKIIKNEGLSKQTIRRVKKLLKAKGIPSFFKKGVEEYLKRNSTLLSGYEKLICCSDIVESYFGKFKNQQRQNPEKGVTLGCLKIANYSSKMEQEELLRALEETKVVDLEIWKKENNLKTFNARKKELYKNVG